MSEDLSVAPVDAGAEVVAPPNPIETDNIDHEAVARQQAEQKAKAEEKPAEPAKKGTAREALEKAARTVEKREAAETRDVKTGQFSAKESAKDTPAGIEDTPAAEAKAPVADQKPETAGKPAAAETTETKPAQRHEPPARFSQDAKTEWEKAPESVKAEVNRAVRELETGIEEHRKRFEPIKRYDDMAKQYGTTLHEAMERYVTMDVDLNNDLLGGLERIIRDKTGGEAGLRDIVAHVSGQSPDEAQRGRDTELASMRTELASLRRELSGVSGHLSSQTAADINKTVTDFAADKHLFNELSEQIAAHIKNDGLSLDAAYDKAYSAFQALAEKAGLKPQADPKPSPASVDLIAQTEKGQKSIAGAPSAGSAPATQKPSSSIRDALRKAMASVG